MRKRAIRVEPLVGEAKQWHGLEPFRRRGGVKVHRAGLLIAAGHNLKRWLSETGWGRRQGPLGSLLAVPTRREAGGDVSDRRRTAASARSAAEALQPLAPPLWFG